LSSSHTIAQHRRRLADARDTLFLEKPKQPQAIASGLVTSRFLRSLQPGDIFLDQQRVSDVHTQPPLQSRPPILNRANKPALLLIPILPIFSLCRTSRFIRIGITGRQARLRPAWGRPAGAQQRRLPLRQERLAEIINLAKNLDDPIQHHRLRHSAMAAYLKKPFSHNLLIARKPLIRVT
jgi:hypothetical protein